MAQKLPTSRWLAVSENRFHLISTNSESERELGLRNMGYIPLSPSDKRFVCRCVLCAEGLPVAPARHRAFQPSRTILPTIGMRTRYNRGMHRHLPYPDTLFGLGFPGLATLLEPMLSEFPAPFFLARKFIAPTLHSHPALDGGPKGHWRSGDRIVHAVVNCRSRKVDLPSWELIYRWHPS